MPQKRNSEQQPVEFYANVPISTPVLVPEIEDVDMNGFAWSHEYGLIIKMGDNVTNSIDKLRKLRKNEVLEEDWYANTLKRKYQ